MKRTPSGMTLTQFLRGTLDDPSDFEVQGCLLALMEWADQMATAYSQGGQSVEAGLYTHIANTLRGEADKLSVAYLGEDDEEFDDGEPKPYPMGEED